MDEVKSIPDCESKIFKFELTGTFNKSQDDFSRYDDLTYSANED